MRSVLGIAFLAIGVTLLVWFVRNLLGRKINRAAWFREHPLPCLGVALGFSAAGVWIHPAHDLTIGAVIGLGLGLLLSHVPKRARLFNTYIPL